MAESASIKDQAFLDRLNSGTESAAGELYGKYAQRLCRVAAQLIGQRLGRQYSAEDAAHSALASFFRGTNEKKYHFDRSERLWGLLVTILRHKIQERGRKAREDGLAADIVGDGTSHEEAVALADAVETAMACLKPRHLEICRLFYEEQLSTPEIADRAGCSRWTVRRVLDEFGRRLSGYLGKDADNQEAIAPKPAS
jgi:RNA polymerase sigma factor (sigma-70 family)